MARIFFFFLTCTTVCFAQSSVKLNEIMFYPESGNNEFIELYNNSLYGIDLSGYSIKYYNSSPDFITGTGQGMILSPMSYAIILEADYDTESGIYHELIPPGTLILKIMDNYFGSTGMANTSDRPIWILSPDEDTIDVYTYSADNLQSHSDEKIQAGADSSQSNWLNSVSINGTPGFQNSVIPSAYDIEIDSISISPMIPHEGDIIRINAEVKNTGENPADNFWIRIYNDANLDSIPHPNEEIFSQEYFSLQAGDSLSAVTQIFSAAEGFYDIIVKVDFPLDEDTLDNTGWKSFTVYPRGTQYNDIVINEIMYAPSSGEPEWVEIFNRSSEDVNLNGWKFCDLTTERIITTDDIFISSGDFVVLTRDSILLHFYDVPSPIIKFSLPSLNNTGDAAVIKDSLGFTIDSLIYLPEWGGGDQGRSLERISVDVNSTSEDNWLTCESIYNATPGQTNSVTPKENDLKIARFENSGYAVLGEPAEFKITIKNSGLTSSPAYYISLYHDINKDSAAQSSELISSTNYGTLNSGDTSVCILYAMNFDEGQNYFIAKVNASPDDDTTNNTAYADFMGIEVSEFRSDIVVNEFMYDPESPQPEWIEILNRSSIPVNLKKHQLADSRDTTTISLEDIILLPGSFVVVAADSTIRNYFNINAPLIIKSFSALNNSGDKIILLDSLDRVIDSLEYKSDWGGEGGVSLERIYADSSSTGAFNWGASVSRYGATPGYINSVSPKENDVCVAAVTSSPPYPVFGDDVSLKIKIKNPGLLSANYSIRLYEDTDLDSLPDVSLTNLDGLVLQPGDSTILDLGYTINSLAGAHVYYAEAVLPADMDTSNNYSLTKIYPGYAPNTIIVNEVMYSPEGGEPEWAELYNKSSDSIHLKRWSIYDVISTPSQTRIDSDVVIPPHNYIVLSKDSSVLYYHRLIPSPLAVLNLPVLNNDADGFVLKDERGQTIDSLFFNSNWGGRQGRSLERISVTASTILTSNWGTTEDVEHGTSREGKQYHPKE